MTRTAWGWGLATAIGANVADASVPVEDATPDESAAPDLRLLDDPSQADLLDVWYPAPELGLPPKEAAAPQDLLDLAKDDEVRGVRTVVVLALIDLDAPPAGTADAYLRLHLLSHRLVEPNTLALDGIFSALPNVVWTSAGPCAVDGFESTRRRLLARDGSLVVHAVDKFPRMTDYVLPTGVRIADASRVRLGAYLAPGTTVMHEGFVNFNAGTLGVAMVEGRISQGVVVGDGSDIGGGASIMGTLSGGGTHHVTIGQRSLVGANAGIGISLGDDCVVEAGLYVTAGTKVCVLTGEEHHEPITARKLSGVNGVLFRRNSLNGQVEALPRAGRTVTLNDSLHAH